MSFDTITAALVEDTSLNGAEWLILYQKHAEAIYFDEMAEMEEKINDFH